MVIQTAFILHPKIHPKVHHKVQPRVLPIIDLFNTLWTILIASRSKHVCVAVDVIFLSLYTVNRYLFLIYMQRSEQVKV